MKQLIVIFILSILCGCSFYDRKEEVFKTDQDFVEFWRLYSPDSSMILLNYGLDHGAFGYGYAGTAVLSHSDTTKNLRPFTLPNSLVRFEWLDKMTVSAQFDTIPFIRSGAHPDFKDTKINGIEIKVSSFDNIEPNAELRVEHQEKSPNGKYELVAYRYLNDKHNLNFIHVSVIPAGGKLPKYGNYLIADIHSDYVFDGKWESDNTLIFYSNELNSDMVQYYLVYNRPDIKYKVITDDKKYSSKYRWIKKAAGNNS